MRIMCRRFTTALAFLIALSSAAGAPAVGSRGAAGEQPPVAVSLPLRVPRYAPALREAAEAPGETRGVWTTKKRHKGTNVRATGLRLTSDYAVESGLALVGVAVNDALGDLSGVVGRFYLGHPDEGGTQIGDDLVFEDLPAGSAVADTTSWESFTGAGTIYFVLDPDGAIPEECEEDNADSLGVVLRDDVPWVWQIVNGYCNYASLTMVFNRLGAGNTLYETVELASCAHSAIGVDAELYLNGGVFVCQAVDDYEFAGSIRNMEGEFASAGDWETYLAWLRDRVDAGLPALTGVDPAYLPQPDYEGFAELGLHGAHAVVVSGYTDSSVVVNDPGVGLEFLGPPIPEPEKRGRDVVVDLDDFRLAAESTLGSPFVLVTYESLGAVPSHEEMLDAAISQSIDRFDGLAGSYGDEWYTIWPPGWVPTFGSGAFAVVGADMHLSSFESDYWEAVSDCGGDMALALDVMASQFAMGSWAAELGWAASREFYSGLGRLPADSLAALSDTLAAFAAAATDEYYEVLDAVYFASGNPAAAGPHLPDVEDALAAIASRIDRVRGYLVALGGSRAAASAPRGGVARRALRPAPNPFRDRTTIVASGGAGEGAPGTIEIHDVAGRLVRRLAVGADGRALWDGRDARGQAAAPGVYFARGAPGGACKVVKLE